MNQKTGRFAKSILNSFVILALVAGTVLPVVAQTRKTRRARVTRKVAPPVKYFTINSNEIVRVRMNQNISSSSARVGDTFTTTVVDPVYGSGIELIPAGSVIVGRINQVTRAARKSKAGVLGVEFISLRLPTGISRALNGSLVNLTNESTYDNEGGVAGGSATTRNVVFIGGGAAAGALIGAIAGGGKGAGIGAGVGAGLGVAGAFFSKGKEAEVRPGTEFGVILNQSLSLPAANVR